MRDTAEPGRWWGYLACLWAAIFAGLHFFWALGGDMGLSVASGQALASQRPRWFVLGGLWGVGILCLCGVLLAWSLARRQPAWLPPRMMRWTACAVSVTLLARGIGVEILLLSDTMHLGSSVSSGQRFWTLVLWNPWFIAGGAAFGLAAFGSRKRRPAKSHRG